MRSVYIADDIIKKYNMIKCIMFKKKGANLTYNNTVYYY